MQCENDPISGTEILVKSCVGILGSAFGTMAPDEWAAFFASAATGVFMLVSTFKLIRKKRN